MGFDSGGQGGRGRDPPWIFIHGTDIVEKSLIMLLFFFFFFPSWKGLMVLLCYFSVFFAIFWSFFVPHPLEIFLPTPLGMFKVTKDPVDMLCDSVIEFSFLCDRLNATGGCKTVVNSLNMNWLDEVLKI